MLNLVSLCLNFPEIRAVPLINPGRGGFEELKVHFLMEKEQQQKERLLKDYLLLIEIPVIGLGYDATRIVNAARYLQNSVSSRYDGEMEADTEKPRT